MKHYKQYPSECALASLAMLLDLPYEDVRKKALEVTEGCSWVEWIYRKPAGKKFFEPIHYVLDCFAPHLREYYDRIESSATVNFNGIPENIDLSGKGQITVVWITRSGHVMPYENGKIYDSDLNFPVSLETWLHLFGERVADLSVHPLPAEEPDNARSSGANDAPPSLAT